ncbi:araC family transcriptional regulator [Bordetella ansorpii]|uniref:AraC family transcriptional regulator n=1 Tax=Bordetella ansorpii TaxID=288768 RepID=A0A157SWQ0_9BORD|nr:AraC family transcriptional regulator [Bordetella ansorpii]SAI74493.1 araC family transcriptional regulator [Bordetella ansorpii]
MPHVDSSDTAERLRDEIEAIIERFAAANDSHRTPLPGLSVARITAPVAPTAQLDAPCLCVCIRGSRRISTAETVILHEENHFILTAIELPSVIAIPDASPACPYTALRVDLDLELARQVMAEIDVDGRGSLPHNTRRNVIALDAEMLDSLARLVRLLERPTDIPFMSRLLHREIVYRLLIGAGGAPLRYIVQLGSLGHRVAKAIDWLRANFRERLRIDQLAAKADMGVSTLHRHFHDLTGLSPLQYQKQLRLHEARRMMLESEFDVGRVALEVGYESATQFIREYRRLFGAPPARDVRSIRESSQQRRRLWLASTPHGRSSL